jgi:hypothetical protein
MRKIQQKNSLSEQIIKHNRPWDSSCSLGVVSLDIDHINSLHCDLALLI